MKVKPAEGLGVPVQNHEPTLASPVQKYRRLNRTVLCWGVLQLTSDLAFQDQRTGPRPLLDRRQHRELKHKFWGTFCSF